MSLVVSNLNRSVLERYDYDAFGQRRAALGDPRGGWSWGPSSPREANRGYTGHEMLDAFGLVHMNGRVYDSRTARFLQADPFVQEPNNPQNFNRFTYLWNNPLNATDPSGYLGVKERQAAATILTIVAVAFQQYGAASALEGWGVVAYYAAVGAASSGIATQSWDGAMWGAFSGAVSAGWSLGFDAAGTALWQQALIRGTSDGILSTIRGGKFGSAFAAAGLSTLAGYARQPEGTMGQLVMRTLVGGTVSAATGGKFANGAASAAMAFAVGRGVESSANNARAGGNGKNRLSRNLTTQEKADFEKLVRDAVDEVTEHLRSEYWRAQNEGRLEDAYDLLQARNAMGNADIVFDLDSRGPNGAEMSLGTGEISRKTLQPRAEMRVYKEAYEAYLHGSPAAPGYTLNLSAGKNGILGMVAHESGHAVYWRNYTASGRLLAQRERLADDWVRQVWPGRSF